MDSELFSVGSLPYLFLVMVYGTPFKGILLEARSSSGTPMTGMFHVPSNANNLVELLNCRNKTSVSDKLFVMSLTPLEILCFHH